MASKIIKSTDITVTLDNLPPDLQSGDVAFKSPSGVVRGQVNPLKYALTIIAYVLIACSPITVWLFLNAELVRSIRHLWLVLLGTLLILALGLKVGTEVGKS